MPSSTASRSHSAPDGLDTLKITDIPSSSSIDVNSKKIHEFSNLGQQPAGGNLDRRNSDSSASSTETLAAGPYEEERRRVVKRFGLDGTARREAIDRCAEVAKAHFHTATVIISLVLENKQVLAAEIGWEGETDDQGKAVYSPLRELPLDVDVLHRLDTDDCYVIEDARAGWKDNTNNPYAREGGKLSFFASAPIHLPTSFPELPASVESALLNPKPPPTLPVGSICIIDREPRKKGDAFSEEDRMVLKSIADQIARECEFELVYFLVFFLPFQFLHSSTWYYYI